MYIIQSDLFSGMGKEAVKKILDGAEKHSFEPGEVLFRAGDAAGYFYLLIKGSVRLSLGEKGQPVYMVSHPGEAFGWSSLVGNRNYSATAECQQPTRLVKIDGIQLQQMLDQDPPLGAVFFKHLAAMLGQRLVQSYAGAAAMGVAESQVSFGSGSLVQEAEVQ